MEGTYLSVTDLSESGHLVGESWNGAWFWSPETGMVSIPTLGGNYNVAWALNDSDQAVGWSWTAGNALSQAFVWSPRSGVTPLPSLGGIQSAALDINNHGRIVGYVMPSYAEVDSYGFYTVPVLWTIPDPAPEEDLLRLLIARVEGLRAEGTVTAADANLLLQALESALRFRNGGKAAQSCQALDRFLTHVRQLNKRGALPPATAEELTTLASSALLGLGGQP